MSSSQQPLSQSVQLCELNSDDDCLVKGQRIGSQLTLTLADAVISLQSSSSTTEMQFRIPDYHWMPLTKRIMAFYPNEEPENGNELKSFCLKFETHNDLNSFRIALNTPHSSKSRKRKCPNGKEPIDIKISEFDSRTEEGSAHQYFQFYGSLFQQQNMMQDFTRTATYQQAIHENWQDFRDKVVLDVGAGSGILSFFAAQAGAKRVYAVEASSMAEHCKTLVEANGLSEVIKVITGKIEEVELPECVDVIISEPMGYMLVNERMLESYVHARKFLKKGGRMYPTEANLHIALFSDEQLYLEQSARSSFWTQESFHGVNLSSLKMPALREIFHQPVVDSWHTGILASKSTVWNFDFENDSVDLFRRIDIPFELAALKTGYIHGIATWFDVGFVGQKRKIWLSTAPTEPLTHWYQVRCLLQTPLFVLENQLVTGEFTMVANDKQSYDLELVIEVDGQRQRNTLDLKMPYFRYTGQPIVQPPGNSSENPSEQLNQNLVVANPSVQANKDLQLYDYLAASNIAINGHIETTEGKQ